MTTIAVNGRPLRLHKAIVAPSFRSRTVLTREPWAFVRLFLRRNGQDDALFFWNQAKTFHDAAAGLPLESAPLLLYYAYMNAAKALLTAKHVSFKPYHGVREWQTGATGRDPLKKVGVEIKPDGVLPSLAAHLGDQETANRHSLQELFFNMPFIHRTYCLTYPGQADMYIPLRDCRFARDSATQTAHFAANLSHDFSARRIIKGLPGSLVADHPMGGNAAIRSSASCQFNGKRSANDADLALLRHYPKGVEDRREVCVRARWQNGQRGSQAAIARAMANRTVMKLSSKCRSGRDCVRVARSFPGGRGGEMPRTFGNDERVAA